MLAEKGNSEFTAQRSTAPVASRNVAYECNGGVSKKLKLASYLLHALDMSNCRCNT